jgi:hypothetical protein
MFRRVPWREATDVDTLKLRQIQHPSEVDRLLESYISRIVPKDAYPIRKAAAVPRELRGLVMQAVKLGKTWSCWTQGIETWLFTAEMSLPLSRERGAPVLHVKRYGDEGSLRESATLMTDQTGKWCRCAD